MSPLPTVGTSGTGSISASYLNQLIQASLELQRRPLELLQAEQDRIEIQRSVYRDLNSMLTNLRSEACKLMSGEGSTLDDKLVTSSDSSVVSASAGSTAMTGVHTIEISHLAQAHQVRSDTVLYSDQPLGLSGTFVLGARASRAASWTPDAAGVVTGGGTASLADGQIELQSGDYYVETQESSPGVWQFRLVDDDGHAITIANASEAGSYTSSWQTLADGVSSYDTGRGLTIDFSDVRAANLRPAAARVTYDAQGAVITVTPSDTLEQIRDAINSATYAQDERVRATIVANNLILTAARTGLDQSIRVSTVDEPTGDVLSGLGLWDAGAWLQETQAAQDASFSVNGIALTRDQNTGLDDVIGGVTLDLLKETAGSSVTLTVKNDDDALTGQINTLVSLFNKTTSYLRDKTAVTEQSDGTYSRGTLAGDSVFGRLRTDLITELLGSVSGLSEGTPTTLAEIGLTFSVENLQLSLSDGAKLSAALEEDRPGVGELLDAVMGRLTDLIDRFAGEDSLLDKSGDQLDVELDRLADRKRSLEDRLTAQEKMLTQRYALVLQQLAAMQTQSSTLSAFTSFNTMV